ncbi:unnamed protein product [Brugia timori]|uniref:Mut7-C domain-containing protein n=1 Tax=Brugia timori TaxID=42155 RepID=A0A0R3QQV3_9BILA|nr:unnamed protein product [Brugia timori]
MNNEEALLWKMYPPVYFSELVQQMQNVESSWITDLITITRSRLTNNFHFFYKRVTTTNIYSGLKVSECDLQSVVNAKIQIQMNEAIVTATISYTDGMRNQKLGYIKLIDESFCDKIHSYMSKLQNRPYSILSLYTTNRKDGNAITSATVTCRKCSKEVYDVEKILAGGMITVPISVDCRENFVCEVCRKLQEQYAFDVASDIAITKHTIWITGLKPHLVTLFAQ